MTCEEEGTNAEAATQTLSSSSALTATNTNIVLGDYVEPEDVADYDDLREFFSLPISLAAVDDIAKWLVGLSSTFAATGGGLRLAGVFERASGRITGSLVLLAASLVGAVIARVPLPVYVNRRSRQQMQRTAQRLLLFRGICVLLAVVAFAAAVVVAGASGLKP